MTATAAAHTLRADAEVIGLVCIGHLMSHFYGLVVPPIFFLLRAEFGVGYAAMGLAMTLFYVASGLLQTPAGFLVDRLGADRAGGRADAGFRGTLLIGFAPSYTMLLAAFMIAGAATACSIRPTWRCSMPG